LLDVVARALEKDRDKRFQTADALGRELQLIRKTHQLSNLPPMEATRFASTNVLRALHEDRQKEDQGLARDKTLQPGPASPAVAPATGAKTLIIGAVAAVVLLAAIGAWILTRPDSTPQNTPAVVQTPAQASPTPPPAATSQPETTKPEPVAEKKSAPVKKAATPPVTAPVDPPPAPPRPGNIVVALSAAYPFEVRDGSRVVSAAATSHELAGQANGRTLRLMAAEVMLDHPVKIDGGDDNRFEYSPPGLGRINIRAARGDCKAMIGKRDLGFGPWPPLQVAAGDYRVELICPDGLNPFQQVTVVQGRTAEVRIQQK
jgi:hypothetical protein